MSRETKWYQAWAKYQPGNIPARLHLPVGAPTTDPDQATKDADAAREKFKVPDFIFEPRVIWPLEPDFDTGD